MSWTHTYVVEPKTEWAFDHFVRLIPFAFPGARGTWEFAESGGRRVTFDSSGSGPSSDDLAAFFVGVTAFLDEQHPLPSDAAFELIAPIDPPYCIRNALKNQRCRNDVEAFERWRPVLESSRTTRYQLTLGNLQVARIRFLEDTLAFDRSLVDIGCGSGEYAVPFARRLPEGARVYGIDPDPKERERIQARAAEHDIDNLRTFASYESFLAGPERPSQPDQVMMEVIEHMPIEAARSLVDAALDYPGWNRFVLSTPDTAFNPFYADSLLHGSERYRHHDHYFELDYDGFGHFVSERVNGRFDFELFKLGDLVDGLSPTTAAVIVRR